MVFHCVKWDDVLVHSRTLFGKPEKREGMGSKIECALDTCLYSIHIKNSHTDIALSPL